MAVKEEILLDIKVQNQEALKNIEKLSDANELLKNRIKLLNDAVKDGIVSEKDATATKAVINAQIKENSSGIRENSKELKTNAASVASAETSINGMRARVADLTAVYNTLSKSARSGDAGKAIASEMKSLNESINGANKSVGNFKDNIGNYGSVLSKFGGEFGSLSSEGVGAFQEISTAIGEFGHKISEMKEVVLAMSETRRAATLLDIEAAEAERVLSLAKEEGVATDEMVATAETLRAEATIAATVATEASAEGLKVLKIALVSTGVGAIVVLLGSLAAWFSQTEEGSRALSKGLAVVGAVFKELGGFLAKTVQSVIDFSSGIKDFPDLMKKIGNAIEENLINRLKGFGVIFKAVGELLAGDFKKGMKDLTDGVVQTSTGVTNATDKIAEAGKKMAEGIEGATTSALKIQNLKRNLEEYEVASTVRLAKLNADLAKYTAALGKAGQSMTTADREAAVKGALETEDAILLINLNISKKKRNLARAEYIEAQKQSGNAKLEEKKKYEEAQAELIKLQGEFEADKLNKIAKGSKLYNQVMDIQLTAEKDAYNQTKAINLQKLNDNRVSLEDKLNILNSLKKSEDESYEDQKASFQQYQDSVDKLRDDGVKHTIDFNELIKISDGKAMAAKMEEIKLSVAAQKSLLSILDARRAATTELTASDIKLAKERMDSLVLELQQELKINELKNKEIRAGRKNTSEEEIADLNQKHDEELKILNAKYTDEQKLDVEYKNAKAVLDQQFATDQAVLEAKIQQDRLDTKAADYANELEGLSDFSNRQTEIKKSQLDMQLAAELKSAETSGANTVLIEKKYAKLKKNVDDEANKAKLNSAKVITDGLADLFGKTTKAGKLAAAASVAISTYQGAQEAIASVGKMGVFGWPLGIAQAGVIIAGGVKAISDIYSVSDSGSASSPSASASSAKNTTTYTNLPTISSMYTSGAGQAEQAQVIAQSVPTPVVSVSEITNMQNTVKVKENTKI